MQQGLTFSLLKFLKRRTNGINGTVAIHLLIARLHCAEETRIITCRSDDLKEMAGREFQTRFATDFGSKREAQRIVIVLGITFRYNRALVFCCERNVTSWTELCSFATCTSRERWKTANFSFAILIITKHKRYLNVICIHMYLIIF